MTAYFTTWPSRFGPFSVAVDDAGAVVATAFGDVTLLARRLGGAPTLQRDDRRTQETREQLHQYFAGQRFTFSLALRPLGTSFQQRVWQALQKIPPAETRTYGQLATALGSAARAVGRANATNPICVIIPCHRVIGAGGKLTGFAFGEPIKQALLDLERAHAPSQPLTLAGT